MKYAILFALIFVASGVGGYAHAELRSQGADQPPPPIKIPTVALSQGRRLLYDLERDPRSGKLYTALERAYPAETHDLFEQWAALLGRKAPQAEVSKLFGDRFQTLVKQAILLVPNAPDRSIINYAKAEGAYYTGLWHYDPALCFRVIAQDGQLGDAAPVDLDLALDELITAKFNAAADARANPTSHSAVTDSDRKIMADAASKLRATPKFQDPAGHTVSDQSPEGQCRIIASFMSVADQTPPDVAARFYADYYRRWIAISSKPRAAPAKP